MESGPVGPPHQFDHETRSPTMTCGASSINRGDGAPDGRVPSKTAWSGWPDEVTKLAPARVLGNVHVLAPVFSTPTVTHSAPPPEATDCVLVSHAERLPTWQADVGEVTGTVVELEGDTGGCDVDVGLG
jgi:hypothetical protein